MPNLNAYNWRLHPADQDPLRWDEVLDQLDDGFADLDQMDEDETSLKNYADWN